MRRGVEYWVQYIRKAFPKRKFGKLPFKAAQLALLSSRQEGASIDEADKPDTADRQLKLKFAIMEISVQ